MNLRTFLVALGTTCFTVPVLADCFDTPTWQGESLTQSYVDGLEQSVRRASLSMLLLSEEPAQEKRDELERLLMRTALIQFDGDRGALRKKLLEEPLYDVIQLIDFARSNPRDQSNIMAAYWLNGCVEKSLDLLATATNPLTSQYYMPIATEDTELLRSLAERLEPGGYQRRRLLTFAKLLERPDAKEDILQEFLDFLVSEMKDGEIEDAIDAAGLTIALNTIRNQRPDLELLQSQPSIDVTDRKLNGMRFSAFVAWMSAAGYCEATWKTSFVLLGSSPETMPLHRELLEASVIRCLGKHER